MGTILVIEDDAQILKVLHRLFAAEGYVIVSASNGTQGLELFSTQTVDAVVLDLMLPGVSGRDICRSMKQSAPRTRPDASWSIGAGYLSFNEAKCAGHSGRNCQRNL